MYSVLGTHKSIWVLGKILKPKMNIVVICELLVLVSLFFFLYRRLKFIILYYFLNEMQIFYYSVIF